MRLLIINVYYQDLIDKVYRQNSGLAHQPFDVQHETWMGSLLGSADFYSHNLRRLGHEAKDLVINIEPMQRQWAKEHGVKVGRTEWRMRMRRGVVPWFNRFRVDDWMWATLAAQIRDYRPDVLYCMPVGIMTQEFLSSIRPYVRMIVGQHAATPLTEDIRSFDLLFSAVASQVDSFRSRGTRSELLRLAFEPRFLDKITKRPKTSDIVFVGGFSGIHEGGTEILERLTNIGKVSIWGYGVDKLVPDSPIRELCQGILWGYPMYQALMDGRLVFNRHSSTADLLYASNLRLYEGTGVGSCLLTDWKPNLASLFEPEKEVVTYSTPDEAIEKAKYYLGHLEELEGIAAAGQRRTLKEHTWYHRMQEMVEIVSRYV